MIQPKYSPKEALEKIKLMMKYDSSKTLNENREIIFEQVTAGEASSIAEELWSHMAGDVETEDLNEVQDLLNTKVFGQTFKDGCLLSKVLEYYKGHQGSITWSWGSTYYTGGFMDDLMHSDEYGEPEFEDVKKDLMDSVNKELEGFCKKTSPTPKPDEDKKDDGKEVVKKGGGSGYKSTYTPCTPGKYVRGCKSEVVRKVQACLKQAPKHQTGNFGPITQGNLQKLGKGFENGFTDADVATICQTETVKKLGNDVESQTLGQDMASDTNIPSNPNQQGSTTKTGIN